MKVVIFCGGQGVRMGDETKRIPKPMVRIGDRPILWHIMRYYAGFGHTEFILCLGQKGDAIRTYFLDSHAALFDDFVIDGYGARPRIVPVGDGHGANGHEPWRISFVSTGARTSIAERLQAVEHCLGEDDVFLFTYGDGLTDASQPELIRWFHKSGKLATFLSVRPQFTCHVVTTDPDGTVSSLEEMGTSSVRINGGFFVARRELLDRILPGEDLVDTLARLAPRGEVGAYVYDGFFGAMDTIKDRMRLEELYEQGNAPWQQLGGPARVASVAR